MVLLRISVLLVCLPQLSLGVCDDEFREVAARVGNYYFEGRCDRLNQTDAKNFCYKVGGWLGEARTKTLRDGLSTILLTKPRVATYFYQGLERHNGVWKWNSGQPYNNIPPEQSGDAGKTGDQGNCSTHGAGVGWNDWFCDRTQRFFCQFDICNDNACTGNRSCKPSDLDNTITYCKCGVGFFGRNCKDGYCDVTENPCENSGTCVSTYDESYYGCNCPLGYYGRNCRDGFCDVYGATCGDRGSCESKFADPPYYQCDCNAGYYGINCTEGYCDEHANACNMNGECVNNYVSTPYYRCNCTAGHYGLNCSIGYCEVEMHTNPCLNDGKCKSNRNTPPYYECSCTSGHFGPVCNDMFCETYPNTCQNGGMCISNGTAEPYYHCNCTDGYIGDNCNESISGTIWTISAIIGSVALILVVAIVTITVVCFKKKYEGKMSTIKTAKETSSSPYMNAQMRKNQMKETHELNVTSNTNNGPNVDQHYIAAISYREGTTGVYEAVESQKSSSITAASVSQPHAHATPRCCSQNIRLFERAQGYDNVNFSQGDQRDCVYSKVDEDAYEPVRKTTAT